MFIKYSIFQIKLMINFAEYQTKYGISWVLLPPICHLTFDKAFNSIYKLKNN